MAHNFYDRSIALTGTLSPPVAVNNSSLIQTLDYSVQMTADINNNHLYMQGGPGKAVAEFQKKVVKGKFSCPIKINESNIFQPALNAIIDCGTDFETTIALQTFMNPYNPNIIAENDAYFAPNNSLIFDTCVVESMGVNIKKEGSAIVDVLIRGMVDNPNTAEIAIPADDTNLYRNLTWYDCLFSRNGSQLENAEEIEIRIEKEVDERYFLNYCAEYTRTDAPFSLGILSVNVTFKIIEYITSEFDIFSYSLGGFFDDYTFSGHIGNLNFSIPDATLKISAQNITSDIIKRTTEGFYRMAPNTPYNDNFVFTLT